MDFLLTTGGAGMAAFLLVALYKMAVPSSPPYGVVLVSLFSGISTAILVEFSKPEPLTRQRIASSIIAGVFASATAAGVRSIDNKADQERGIAQEAKSFADSLKRG